MFKPFEHQTITTDFINKNDRCLITSDPGTGKTRSVLDAIANRESRILVLAPLSILEIDLYHLIYCVHSRHF